MEIHIVDDMETALLEIAYKSMRQYNFQYITGVSFENDTAIAWFNNQATHSAALALYFVHDTFIKRILGKEYGIEVSNAPLNKLSPSDGSTGSNNPQHSESTQNFAQFASFVVVSMALLSTFYISFYIKVRHFIFHGTRLFLNVDYDGGFIFIYFFQN